MEKVGKILLIAIIAIPVAILTAGKVNLFKNLN